MAEGGAVVDDYRPQRVLITGGAGESPSRGVVLTIPTGALMGCMNGDFVCVCFQVTPTTSDMPE
jgi:hypothetical protein